MTLFIAFGLGFLIAVNLLLAIGLAAYHFTVTTNTPDRQEKAGWRNRWAPQQSGHVGENQYRNGAIPVTTRSAGRRNSVG